MPASNKFYYYAVIIPMYRSTIPVVPTEKYEGETVGR